MNDNKIDYKTEGFGCVIWPVALILIVLITVLFNSCSIIDDIAYSIENPQCENKIPYYVDIDTVYFYDFDKRMYDLLNMYFKTCYTDTAIIYFTADTVVAGYSPVPNLEGFAKWIKENKVDDEQ